MRGGIEEGMTFIVKTIKRFVIGFILLFGIYITLSGYKSPGGGFAGGVIIALAFIHIMLAFGKDAALKTIRYSALRAAVCITALVFLCMVKIIMPLCEMIIVAGGLFAVFTVLVLVSKSDRLRSR